MRDKAWEFRFSVVMHGETYEDTLDAARNYLAACAAKHELEPVESQQIEGEEDE